MNDQREGRSQKLAIYLGIAAAIVTVGGVIFFAGRFYEKISATSGEDILEEHLKSNCRSSIDQINSIIEMFELNGIVTAELIRLRLLRCKVSARDVLASNVDCEPTPLSDTPTAMCDGIVDRIRSP